MDALYFNMIKNVKKGQRLEGRFRRTKIWGIKGFIEVHEIIATGMYDIFL